MTSRFQRLVLLVISATLLLSACTPAPSRIAPTILPATATSTNAPAPTFTSTVTPVPIPRILLHPGDRYFSVDGRQTVVYSRNLGGSQVAQYIRQLDLSKTGGTLLVRVQLDSMGMGYTKTGAVDEAWARNWEQVFDYAASQGINVLPVFTGWFDWNNGTPDYGYSTWKYNPLNKANGGPTTSPTELFQPGSMTHKLWLNWLKTVVERWQGRPNITAWEIFSEVNIATGTDETNGVAFVEEAAALIREADKQGRPLTASLADVGEWPSFYRSEAVDFLNVHPYPGSGKLDTTIFSMVHRKLAQYGKPVLIGESGLSAATPDSQAGKITVAPHADHGVRHAIWAATVSGSMNGRSLYWEDGFAVYFPALNTAFLNKYEDVELAASRFSSNVDFADLQPLDAKSSEAILGAALGDDDLVIGWFRDAGCEPPDWPLKDVLTAQKVILTVPGEAAQWKIDFYDTSDGTAILRSAIATRNGDTVTVDLPDFKDDIAFKMHAMH